MMSGPPENDALRIDRARVERAAASLSRIERELLMLSAGIGLSNEQIAHRLGITERRVRRRLARALRKFDRAMEPERGPWWRIW